jgi:hypothetical protein
MTIGGRIGAAADEGEEGCLVIAANWMDGSPSA